MTDKRKGRIQHASVVVIAILGSLAAAPLISTYAHAALTADQTKCASGESGAVDICTRVIKDAKHPRLKALWTSLRGLAYAKAGECDLAIADQTEAVALTLRGEGRSSDDYQNYSLRLGNVWADCKGDQAKAIAIYGEPIKLRPTEPAAYLNRAKSKRTMGDRDGAIADAEAVLRIARKDENKASAYNGRALAWKDKGDLDRALSDFNNSLRLNPDNYLALSNRGVTWRLKGDLARALADQSRSIELTAKSPVAYIQRGDTYRYLSDFDSAMKDYRAALQLAPDYTPALTGIGLTYEKMGDNAQARAFFLQSVSQTGSARVGDVKESALETAYARLAALDSGAEQPAIPAVPLKAASPTSVPTPAIVAPKPIATGPATARQGRRVALVIGNSAYVKKPLTNPKNDAEAVATSLRNIGFESVTLTSDATREKLIDALRNFANEAENSDWAMIYYAGHGFEVGGVNYLVPVDARLAVDRDIEYEAIPLSQLLRATGAARKLRLVMLDACRDNPFTPRKTETTDVAVPAEPSTGGATATRSSSGRGLAEVKVTGATLVVFAAKDGQVALDGQGGNSPFAVAVVQRIATPGVELNKIIRLVRDDVMEATGGRQEPYTYGSLPAKEDFYFVAK